ncbi:MAG: hypothetical protein KBA26_09175 [Candidatus Delongbacteria bacterium]|nr:hypothetical protein [Candidatus Delongbacteria bacterium]
MKKNVWILIGLELLLIIQVTAGPWSDLKLPHRFHSPHPVLNRKPAGSDIPSNDIFELYYDGTALWVLTSAGLGRTLDLGNSWEYHLDYDQINQYIFAMGMHQDTYYAFGGYLRDYSGFDAAVPVGTGPFIRSAAQTEWTHQSILFADEFPQKIGMDVAFLDSTVFSAYLRGNLLRKSLSDSVWTVIIPDSDTANDHYPTRDYPPNKNYDYLNDFNNIALTVKVDGDGIIWLGTAAGLKKSTDRGKTFVSYGFPITPGFPGSQIWELFVHSWNSQKYLFAACTGSGGQNEKDGLAYSADGGENWQSVDHFDYIAPLALAAQDSTLWVGTDHGLFAWNFVTDSLRFFDKSSGLPDDYIASLLAMDFHLWIGTNNGLAYTVNQGRSFNFFKTSFPVTSVDIKPTYSFPNPFSPVQGQDCQIVFATAREDEVELVIYDNALKPVRHLVNQLFPAGDRHIVLWNGRNDQGQQVPNGVYFYILKTAHSQNSKPVFNKIVVMN